MTALKRSQTNLKRYRAAVLKAACEGRLVPTEAALAQAEGRTYEPATVLLERILSERRRKWTAENPKKKYQEPIAPDTSALPELPEGWCWSTFNQVGEVASDLIDPTLTPDIPHIAPNHIEKETGRLLPYTTVKEDGVASPKHRFRPGQILYSKIRPYLAKVIVVNFYGVCSADMYPVNSYIKEKFLWIWMLSREFTRLAAGHQGRTVLPKINQDALGLLPVPVAPMKEQYRIVTEVERRFSLIDQLEKTIKADLARANRLRQSILKRAFAGKLVPQDPTDEPAAVLLERIKAAKNGQPVQTTLLLV